MYDVGLHYIRNLFCVVIIWFEDCSSGAGSHLSKCHLIQLKAARLWIGWQCKDCFISLKASPPPAWNNKRNIAESEAFLFEGRINHNFWRKVWLRNEVLHYCKQLCTEIWILFSNKDKVSKCCGRTCTLSTLQNVRARFWTDVARTPSTVNGSVAPLCPLCCLLVEVNRNTELETRQRWHCSLTFGITGFNVTFFHTDCASLSTCGSCFSLRGIDSGCQRQARLSIE